MRLSLSGRSSGCEHTVAEKLVTCATVHLALDGLQPIDLAFDGTGAPLLGDRSADGRQVARKIFRQDAELAVRRDGKPLVEFRCIMVFKDGGKARGECRCCRKPGRCGGQMRNELPLVCRQAVGRAAKQPSATPLRRRTPRGGRLREDYVTR